MLNIINKSPFESQALASCLRLAPAHSVVLLIEDAVIALVHPLAQQLKLFQVYLLQADLQARGLLDHVNSSVQIVDYSGFVELTAAHNPIQSWS